MVESKAQKKANKKWINKNREHANYLRYRNTARLFVRKHATTEDLDELVKLIDDRRKELNSN